MAHYNFHKDLEDGHLAETEAIEKIKTRLAIGDEDIERSAGKGFDFKVKSKGWTFEVKNDLMAGNTGNIAIEYESRGKPTALSVTQADFWIYKFSDSFWAISTVRLRQKLFDEKCFFKAVTGGDAGSHTKMFLVKTEVFKTWAKEI